MYFLKDLTKVLFIAKGIESIDHSTLFQEYIFCISPCRVRSAKDKRLFVLRSFLRHLIKFGKVPIPIEFKGKALDCLNLSVFNVLEELEFVHNCLECYIFIANHFKNEFYEVDEAFELKNEINKKIDGVILDKQGEYWRV